MMRFADVVQLQTISGTPVSRGAVTVTPLSRALAIHLPWAGFVWNRPVAVLVEREGWTERIPIVDVTRLGQLGLLVLVLFISFAVRIKSDRRKESSDERAVR